MVLIKKGVPHTRVKKREVSWYAWLHNDPRANEIVARQLGGEGYEDRLRRKVLCDDGVIRDLWRVTHSESLLVKHAAREFGFEVTIFVERPPGKPSVWIDPGILRHLAAKKKKAGVR